MIHPGTATFEQSFPGAFVDAVRGLVEGVPLDDLLTRLCDAVSTHIAPTTVHIAGHGPDATSNQGGGGYTELDAEADVTSPRRTTVDVTLADGQRWGQILLSGPPGQPVDEQEAETIAALATWLIDNHAARRRRVATVDRERQLIAGQLHDDSIQAMTAISLNLQRLARSPGVDRDQIEHLLFLANDAIERLRHMMFALHPPALAEDGLVRTVGDYLDAFISPSGLTASIQGPEHLPTTPEMEALAFRLIRAAVHNAWKHAHANRLDVTIELVASRLKMVVEDDGIGFDLSPERHAVGHAGIEYSADLAREVGGSYNVRSAPGQGTTVTILLPTT